LVGDLLTDGFELKHPQRVHETSLYLASRRCAGQTPVNAIKSVFRRIQYHQIMISLFAALFAMAPAEPVTILPTDDIWVYEHAADPVSDEFLRVWGSDNGPIGDYLGDYSFSCLKFTLPEGIDPSKLESAKLVVYSIPEVNWSAETSKQLPLQARRLSGDFDETKWEYSKNKFLITKAGEDQVYGDGSGTPGDSKPFAIEIDLLKGKADFKEALKDKHLEVALTSPMNPQDASGSVYKVYSRNATEEALRPRLVLKFAD
jgi:hypothetical protein